VPGAKTKGFCEDKGIDFFGEVFLGFNRGHHCLGPLMNFSFYEGFLTVFPMFFSHFSTSRNIGHVKKNLLFVY
jgi:hypothetical protein